MNSPFYAALATYRAACERWPGTPVTLRQGARVIEDSRRLRAVNKSTAGHEDRTPTQDEGDPTQRNTANGVEFRIMPSDDEGHWYWEVIKDGREVVVSDGSDGGGMVNNER
jgi:hypothetical protein